MSPSLTRFLKKGKQIGSTVKKKGAKILNNLDDASDSVLSVAKKKRNRSGV